MFDQNLVQDDFFYQTGGREYIFIWFLKLDMYLNIIYTNYHMEKNPLSTWLVSYGIEITVMFFRHQDILYIYLIQYRLFELT
jgi:hypothetical protein